LLVAQEKAEAARVVDIMTDPASAPEAAALAFALDLLWPRTEIDGMKLIKTVELTLRPGAKLEERKAAYAAARAVLSAWNVTDGHAARPGRPEDLRGPAEAMLQAFGMKLERIAEFTEPQVRPAEGADRVKHRIRRFLEPTDQLPGPTIDKKVVRQQQQGGGGGIHGHSPQKPGPFAHSSTASVRLLQASPDAAACRLRHLHRGTQTTATANSVRARRPET
jgi:hypothetical protein